MAVQGRKRRPVPSGESPRANWKNWLVRNAAEKIAPLIRNWVVTAAEKPVDRKMASGIIGSGARQLSNDEAQEQRRAEGQADQVVGASPAHLPAFDEAPDQRGQTSRHKDQSRDVESGARAPALGQAQPRPDGGDDTDGNVDPEDPVPIELLSDGAADEGATGDGEPGDTAPDPDHGTAPLRGERPGEQGETERHDDCRAHALEGPEGNERPC